VLDGCRCWLLFVVVVVIKLACAKANSVMGSFVPPNEERADDPRLGDAPHGRFGATEIRSIFAFDAFSNGKNLY